MLHFFTILAAAVVAVHGFSGGAPASVCKSLLPGHPAEPQATPSPFRIVVNKSTVKPGQEVMVIMESTNDKRFKGFLLQARINDEIVGHFDVSDVDKNIQTLDCLGGSKNAITHRNSDDKKAIVAKWIAPENVKGTVKFVGTFVETGLVFWVGETSEEVSLEH
ncbi:putative defense protein Hdd11 [Cephus cinctus]|uniref:Defense protein Hdd11 n=1 Tax=Cephus cinctus TaxID=211228 RepID=A0AAJ7FEQ8_CEPCN|nr:putative defense protein Hdd11 [Cephus cinctus]